MSITLKSLQGIIFFVLIFHLSFSQDYYQPKNAISTDNIRYTKYYEGALSSYTEFKWNIDFKLEILTPLFESGKISSFYLKISPIILLTNIENPLLAPRKLSRPGLTFGENGNQPHDRIIQINCGLFGLGKHYNYNNITISHDRFVPGDYKVKSKSSHSDSPIVINFSVGYAKSVGPFSLAISPSDPDPFDLDFNDEGNRLNFGLNMCSAPYFPIDPMYYDGGQFEIYDLQTILDDANDTTEIGEIVVQIYPNRLLNYNIFEYDEIYDLKRIELKAQYVRANSIKQPTMQWISDTNEYNIGDTVVAFPENRTG